jgi:peptidoglycan/xylan/chitin deacetylase (PgdA/CDA1 family)/lysophospholipase L1-like esterase
MKNSLQLICVIGTLFLSSVVGAQTMVQVNASDPNIQYVGRVNNTDPNNVVFAFPGVSIKAKFQGTAINAIVVEGGSGGSSTTNYFNVIIDGGTPTVLKLSTAQTVYVLATGLTDVTHTVELYKRTETSVGKVTFKGFQVVSGKTLVTPDPLPSRKIMFIGNSITCGYGNESSSNPPVNGFTSVNENNYKAWGAVTARNLNAQYHSISYSGRGLYRNNSGSQVGTAPTFFDQTIADDASQTWDHSKYVPDVVVLNLGTNDFAAEVASAAYTVDQTTFTTAYLNFISKIRTDYPNAKIFCTVGVMMSDYYPAGGLHWTRIQNYVQSVVTTKNNAGDTNVFYYMMDPQSPPYGEDWHPTAATDVIMATGITNFINSKVTWTSCPGSVNLGNDLNLNTTTFPVTLNSNSTTGTGVTYKWYKDGILISGAASSTYQITSKTGAAAIYKVERDSATCVLQDQMEITSVLVPVGEICKWDNNKKAAVALTFDDWTPGQSPIVVPELKARNLVATFNIFTSNITDWTSVNTAANNGNEIANHTKTHVYANGSSMYATEVLSPKTIIETNVPSQKVYSFAYPFGSFDDNLIAYLQSSGHVGARGVYPSTGNYSYNFAPTINDYYKILTTTIDASLTTSAFTTQIQNIITGGGFLTYMYHSVNSATITDNVYNTISQTALQAQLDALVTYKNTVWITTFGQALKYHREARCATLGEVQPADGIQWVVKLTDTLSDNATFNQPLSIRLKMNSIKYDQISQNGNAVTIDYQANDTIMFHAIPDGGNIVLKASSGIAMSASATPTNITNSGSAIVVFSVNATATSPSIVSSVKLDLSAIGGGNTIAMTSSGANTFSYSYTVASGVSVGTKSITITATDNASHTQSTTVSLAIDGGTVISSASVNPSTVLNNVANNLTFAIHATDDGSIASVNLDLSAIGGGSAVAMSSTGSNNYTASYTLPINASTGTKTITATVTDNVGNIKQTTVSLTVNPSVTYLDIYTDATTMICPTCFWPGTALTEQSNKGAIEGIKDYVYNYTISGYWAGMGMNITNWDETQAKDFSGYDNFELSYKGPITAGTGFTVSLVGLANVKSTSVAVTGSSSYTTIKIALKDFGTFNLTKITQIAIDITGTASGTGSLQLDNIRLSKAVVVTVIPVTAITFSPAVSTAMNVGETQNITTVITPLNATDASISWSTSDASIATVSAGSITAVKAGTVTITATSLQNPTISKSVTILVSSVIPTTINQTVTLNGGWNIISFNVIPTDSTIETVFKDIIANIVEIKTQDSFWSSSQIPAFNSLKTITEGGAYLVKMKASGTLSIMGFPVETRLIASLHPGWNLVGCEYQTTTPLSSIFNTTNCVSVKNFDGFWIPSGSLNSISTVDPGKGYFVKAK